MASYFIYDSINMYRSDNTVSEGTFSGTTFTASDSLTNHERVADQNIGYAISGVAANEAICYQVGSAANADALAMRFSGDCGIGVQDGSENTIRFGTALDGLSGAVNFASGSTVASWRIKTFTEVTNKTKFCVEFNDAQTNISEILIGKKLSFEVEPDVNVQSSINYENEVQRSLGGVEYAINVNEGQEVHTISFQNISSTFKSDLITMQDALKGESKKFVWNDGTTTHWVRLDKPMTFTEIADGRFSTQLVLRQQIQ
tara:strand:+ start:1238 stop:2011 length:774 start_codon:yes stop_codon:yes gene_type:complete